MDLLLLACVYLAVAILFIGLLLFGEHPSFRGTPVAWGHWLITQGVWVGLEWLLVKACGARAARWLDVALEWCCDKPNPTLQISYVALLALGFYWFCGHIFVLLPNPWASEWHMFTGTLSVLLSTTTFVLACRSDPGIITPYNLAAHTALYPYDGMLWHKKTCVTCRWERPARSKHCRVCGHCIARHDHHCGWINNCVGLGNHRVFLAFLVSNMLMCVYGAALAVMVLLGEADTRGVLRRRVLDYTTGRLIWVRPPASQLFKWLLVWYTLPVALALFLTAASLLIACFLGYQLTLIAQGNTQYEVHRWRDLYAAMLLQQSAAAGSSNAATQSSNAAAGSSDAAAVQATGRLSGHRREAAAGSSSVADGGRQESAALGTDGQAKEQHSGKAIEAGAGTSRHVTRMRKDAYNKGVIRNLYEVLFPHECLAAALKANHVKQK